MTPAHSAVIAAERLARALQSISPQGRMLSRPALRLLGRGDAFERVVPARLLEESFARALDDSAPDAAPLVVVFDRLGGAEGAEASAGLLRILASRCTGAALVHVAFNTQSRGLGSLIRSGLTQTGVELGIPVEVAAHDRPAWALKATPREVDEMLAGIDLVVTFAPRGAAGLQGQADVEPRRDLLLERSHVAVLCYPDPESLVAGLDDFTAIVDEEPGMDSLRFWVQVDGEGGREELGHALLGLGGDARERLWVLLDNARRRRYRALVEPMLRRLPAGIPLICPCRTVIEEQQLREPLNIDRVITAGRGILVAGRGRLAPAAHRPAATSAAQGSSQRAQRSPAGPRRR